MASESKTQHISPVQTAFCTHSSTKELINPYGDNFCAWSLKIPETKEESCYESNDSDDNVNRYLHRKYNNSDDSCGICTLDYVCNPLLPIKTSSSDYYELKSLAVKSFVGKGADYVFDETVRKSFEIKLMEDYSPELDKEFLDFIVKLFDERKGKLMMDNTVLKPHKIVLYEKGSKFKMHRDAQKCREMHRHAQKFTEIHRNA